MASFKMTQGVSRVPEDVFVEDGMTVTSGGLTVTAGGLTVTAGTTTLGGSFVRDVVTLTATDAITQAEHAGRILLMGNTSNYVIKVADATDTIDGSVIVTNDSSAGGTASVISWPTVAASDTITLDGTTTGGVQIGDYVLLTDIATNQYTVSGLLNASGTEATPFSASVS